MRDLHVLSLITLDGATQDQRSWAGPYFDDAAVASGLPLLRAAGAMLMGRGTYAEFSASWPQVPGPYAARLNAMPKLVFSATLEEVGWTGAELVREDAVAAVTRLKAQPGGDLLVYGFTRLARSLLAAGLVDTIEFAVHPVVLGAGAPLHLRRTGAEARPSGVTALRFGTAPDPVP